MSPRSPCRRAVGSRSGSAVIEFALVFPLLTTLLLGMYDLGVTLMVRFKVASATQMVADLASLTATMQTTDITNFFNAGADAMTPFSGSALQLRITNVATDGNGRTFVYWSCARGGPTALTAASNYSATPTGTALTNLLQTTAGKSGNFTLSGANTSFIVVESKLVYTSPAGTVFPSAQTITNTAYTMPRVSTYIGPGNGDPTYVPPAPTAIKSAASTTSSGVTCSTGS